MNLIIIIIIFCVCAYSKKSTHTFSFCKRLVCPSMIFFQRSVYSLMTKYKIRHFKRGFVRKAASKMFIVWNILPLCLLSVRRHSPEYTSKYITKWNDGAYLEQKKTIIIKMKRMHLL